MLFIACIFPAIFVVILALILSGIVMAHFAPAETRLVGKTELVSRWHGLGMFFLSRGIC